MSSNSCISKKGGVLTTTQTPCTVIFRATCHLHVCRLLWCTRTSCCRNPGEGFLCSTCIKLPWMHAGSRKRHIPSKESLLQYWNIMQPNWRILLRYCQTDGFRPAVSTSSNHAVIVPSGPPPVFFVILFPAVPFCRNSRTMEAQIEGGGGMSRSGGARELRHSAANTDEESCNNTHPAQGRHSYHCQNVYRCVLFSAENVLFICRWIKKGESRGYQNVTPRT